MYDDAVDESCSPYVTLAPWVRQVFRAPTPDIIELIGSGFLLRALNSVLLITATHVIDRIGVDEPIVLNDGQGRLTAVGGEVRATCTADAPRAMDDNFDVAITALDNESVTKLVHTPSLTENNLDLNGECDCPKGFMVLGNPINMNKDPIEGKTITVKPYALHTVEANADAYRLLNVTRDQHLVLRFPKKRVYSESGQRRTAPDLHGLSGTPIWGLTPGNEAKVVSVLTRARQGSLKAILSTKLCGRIFENFISSGIPL